jgi:hypothetical protein
LPTKPQHTHIAAASLVRHVRDWVQQRLIILLCSAAEAGVVGCRRCQRWGLQLLGILASFQLLLLLLLLCVCCGHSVTRRCWHACAADGSCVCACSLLQLLAAGQLGRQALHRQLVLVGSAAPPAAATAQFVVHAEFPTRV